MNPRVDYIILGAGGAGLSLLMRILDEPALAGKKIMLIDRGPKITNDRTWCFWENGEGYFENIIHHRWENLAVKHPKGTVKLSMGGYAYKMLRATDFYKYCFGRVNQSTQQVQLVYGNVTGIDAAEGRVTVDGFTYEAEYIFSSVLTKPPLLNKKQHYLLQHFRGWWIETESDSFDPEQADLMNFNVPQTQGCTFVYVLPLSRRQALVEYTIFSEKELEDGQYDEGLKHFLQHELNLTGYRIIDVENGVIPMTNYRFAGKDQKVIYIGTAGGQTKASTGYTFSNMQKHATRIVQGLMLKNPQLFTHPAPPRFRLYDSILLRVLREQKLSGADVFFSIFNKNPASTVFRFLDNESNLREDWRIMVKVPWRVFTQAALREIL